MHVKNTSSTTSRISLHTNKVNNKKQDKKSYPRATITHTIGGLRVFGIVRDARACAPALEDHCALIDGAEGGDKAAATAAGRIVAYTRQCGNDFE